MLPEQFMPIGVPKIDAYLEGDSVVEIGEVPFSVYSTPGHTPGCMSFSFPVFDNGTEHTACIFGGLGMPRTVEEQRQFLTTSNDFLNICKQIGADVELSTHPFVDYLPDKLEKQKAPGAPNPFVIGKKRVELFMDCMIASIENTIAAQ
jgi:metallo-beta-lactamase class B